LLVLAVEVVVAGPLSMSGVVCTDVWRLLHISLAVGWQKGLAERSLGEGVAEFAGGGSHENAGPEELGECCGDAGGRGQDQGGAADRCQDLGRGHWRPAFRRVPA
jgi:hypothetical protein